MLGDRGKVRISLTPMQCIQFVLMHSFHFFLQSDNVLMNIEAADVNVCSEVL